MKLRKLAVLGWGLVLLGNKWPIAIFPGVGVLPLPFTYVNESGCENAGLSLLFQQQGQYFACSSYNGSKGKTDIFQTQADGSIEQIH